MKQLQNRYNSNYFSFLNLWSNRYAITFKPALRSTRPLGEREDWNYFEIDKRIATASDKWVSAMALKAVMNHAFAILYGRRWHQRTDIRFTAYAVPETRSRDGLDLTPLHYHIAFGCEPFGLIALDVEGAFMDANKRVTRRVFGQRTDLYIEPMKSEKSYRAYMEKHNTIKQNINDCLVWRDRSQMS